MVTIVIPPADKTGGEAVPGVAGPAKDELDGSAAIIEVASPREIPDESSRHISSRPRARMTNSKAPRARRRFFIKG